METAGRSRLLSLRLYQYQTLEDEMPKSKSLRSRAATVLLALSVLGGLGMSVTACNTTAGAGKDVSATGHAVTNTADKVKSGL
ncbi:MAG TPA: entericidin A/B family lipoprotein [Acetobacteraceae bacterium]|nr:entericidin A/B family lipoprotein [Acetobacteraceae bacterium]